MTCDRGWQAEAIEDGRLRDAGASAFARHAAGCASCAAELAALAALRADLERLPHPKSSELARRQQRQELLRRANSLVVAPPPVRATWLASTIAALAVAVVIGLGRHAPRPAPAAPSTAPVPAAAPASPSTAAVPAAAPNAPPEFEITASQGATWRTLQAGPSTRLAAGSGKLEVYVRPLRAGQRFVFELPDGELEVQGTRFSVVIDAAHTREVRVLEGKVVLRLASGIVQLSAGESWSLPPPPSSPQAPPPRAARKPRLHAPPTAATQLADPLALETPTAGRDFALAMDAFRAGDYSRAEQLFLAFERSHPGDDRVEDALFLRAIAHARRDDAPASRAVAREYLRRYPQGLRRPDAERLAAP